MKDRKPYRFIISGGGTGGHIYPAIAVADEIKRRFADAQILFVGAKGRMEMKKVPEAGYQIIGLWISGIQRRVTIENLKFPFKVIFSYFNARKIIKQFKPDAVLGFGGYASGPIMLAATRQKIPSLVQEQNSHAGITNKGLGKKVKKICVAYENMEAYFPKSKIRLTGNPVRKDIVYSSQKKSEGIDHFKLDPNKKTLLILGGSLGARTINNAILAGIKEIEESGFQVIWQTGKYYHHSMVEKTKPMNLAGVKIKKFINAMDLAYAAADVVVARAGALSVSEIAVVGKPVIFVPSPNVAEDHQTKNAKAYADKEAALIVTDKEAPAKLVNEAIALLKDIDRQNKLGANIKKLAKPDATKSIVDELMEIVN